MFRPSSITFCFVFSLQIKSFDTRCNKVHVDDYYGHTDSVNCLFAWNEKLISSGDDGTVRFWDVNRGTCLKTLEVSK